ncbi:GNAT family N-acetyltransferase [Zoogloea sp.]|uniref:GNAT family N-acetyltransferase n=1 Tax=Zoogloea sp. TaxID=49181 RepID=UPI0026120AAE|nr:GNAT family N-acetyltransferase [Zoogloea sp.]MDD3355108.1 GNAT family N-acetyltransferase [Zoogloea sp.]
MPDFRLHPSIAELPADQWDALVGGQPCLQHAFLDALETSGCVAPRTGWHPRHAGLWDEGTLLAAMPLYLKEHSYGEYVFDWAWADAYQRHGLDYYPKWLSALPFTPVPGRRLLGVDDASRRSLLGHLLNTVAASGASSLHVLFPAADEARWLAEAGLGIRHGVQFHWQNADYRDFEDFLACLSQPKRKKIRQERRKVQEAGVSFRIIEGQAIGTAEWAFFYACYSRTYAEHRSTPYLSRAFFEDLGRRLPQACVLMVAERQGTPIACSFFLREREALYGRYWGALEYLPCLHFEACYYQAIDYAIGQGLQRFEGGAQGEHKLSRGLEPVRTVSAHWIAEPRFRDAVSRYLAQERGGVEAYLDELSERLPFRSAPATPD